MNFLSNPIETRIKDLKNDFSISFLIIHEKGFIMCDSNQKYDTKIKIFKYGGIVVITEYYFEGFIICERVGF